MKNLTLFSIPLVYILIAVAFLFPKIPVIGKFFNIINTAIHELGHALMALLFDGKVYKIELFGDSSGTTTTGSKSKFGSFMISLAGYPFAALMGYCLFYLNGVGYEKGVVIGLPVLFLFMLILWIRNIYGFIWVLLFAALNGGLVYHGNTIYIIVAANFYAICIIIEAISSSFTVVYLAIKQSAKAGDATNLQKQTHIPALIWALIFLAFSGFMGYYCWLML